MAMKIHYNEEDDVFTIYDDEHKPAETIEFSEFLNIDIDKNKGIVGLEIFYASEFLSLFNKSINKVFLKDLSEAHIEYRDFRNMWFIILILKSNDKIISQPLPPLKKSEYISPIIT